VGSELESNVLPIGFSLTQHRQMATRRVKIGECKIRYLRTGSGPTLVFLHTLRTQLGYFFPLIDRLGPGFDPVVRDLPGHGRSSSPPVEYTAGYFTEMTARFIGALDLAAITIVGESIGGSVALALSARRPAWLARVIALNPYDYSDGGGIRRSSPLANVLFRLMSWPGVGQLVLASGTKGILRTLLEGGVVDSANLPPDLVDELWTCGALPGHNRAFLSLVRQWKTWSDARGSYLADGVPVILAYGDRDWSNKAERQANQQQLGLEQYGVLERCSHFSSLDRPDWVAEIIRSNVKAGVREFA
jgi:pimeloyl-ACP methyl ester carboxylesterase